MLLKPLIDHAIGSLGDLSSDLIEQTKQLARIKSKKVWTDHEIRILYRVLRDLAYKCNSDLETWEEEVGVYCPRPQEVDDGEEES